MKIVCNLARVVLEFQLAYDAWRYAHDLKILLIDSCGYRSEEIEFRVYNELTLMEVVARNMVICQLVW
jgi:hypothetical protein